MDTSPEKHGGKWPDSAKKSGLATVRFTARDKPVGVPRAPPPLALETVDLIFFGNQVPYGTRFFRRYEGAISSAEDVMRGSRTPEAM